MRGTFLVALLGAIVQAAVWGASAAPVAAAEQPASAAARDTAALKRGQAMEAAAGAPTACETLYRQSWRLEVLLTRARQQLDTGKVEAALATCRKAQATGLWDFRLQSLFGEVYLRQGKYTDAVIALRNSARSYRDKQLLAQALTAAGWERFGKGQRQDALRLWEEATRTDSQNGWALASLGLGYMVQGDMAGARLRCRLATEAEPSLPAVWDAYGVVLYMTGDLAGAESALCKELELVPDHPTALSNLAFVKLESGATEQAVALWEKALAKRPALVDAQAGLAVGYWRLGETARALWYYRRAALRDKSYMAWQNLTSEHGWSQGAAATAGEIVAALGAE